LMLPQKLDTTIAHKQINLMSDLSGTDKRVAAAIVDHFNRKTGQCDPSLDRLAWLVGLDRRSVIRSINNIAVTGIIRKIRHGGHLQRNSYEPVWAHFRKLEAAWNFRFSDRSRGAENPNMSPEECHAKQLLGGKPVTQTILNNQLNKTLLDSSVHLKAEEGRQPKAGTWLASREATRADKSGSKNYREAARVAAARRWNNELNARFVGSEAYAGIIEAIDTVIFEAATEVELSRRGAGLPYIMDQLRKPNPVSLPQRATHPA
jgi:predicted transcriptional regulator